MPDIDKRATNRALKKLGDTYQLPEEPGPIQPGGYSEQPPAPYSENITEANQYGAIEPGNMDLSRRPHVKNPEGSTSTVRSMGVNLNGKEYLIPTVSEKGYIMDDDEAIDEFYRTGKHMGVYGSPDETSAAGHAIHLDQMANPPANLLLDRPYGPPTAAQAPLNRDAKGQPSGALGKPKKGRG